MILMDVVWDMRIPTHHIPHSSIPYNHNDTKNSQRSPRFLYL
jgi:hypothetical protein